MIAPPELRIEVRTLSRWPLTAIASAPGGPQPVDEEEQVVLADPLHRALGVVGDHPHPRAHDLHEAGARLQAPQGRGGGLQLGADLGQLLLERVVLGAHRGGLLLQRGELVALVSIRAIRVARLASSTSALREVCTAAVVTRTPKTVTTAAAIICGRRRGGGLPPSTRRSAACS